jgi:tetratricopeptide (TPR) repeat protein
MIAEAKLYLKMNQVAPALITARALVADPNATWNDLALMGIAELAAREYDAATHDLLAAKQKAPEDKQSDFAALLKHSVAEAEYSRLLRTAQVTLNRGDKTKAGDLFATGWRIFPDRTDAGFAAITCYLATPQSNRSLSILDVLVQSDDSGVKQRAISLRTSLAEIDKVVFQRRQQAKQIMAAAVARYKAPEDLSDISGKKLAAAEAEAQRALAVDSTMVDAHELLAFCYMRERKYTAAIEQYQAVLSINPKAHVNFWLAWAFWKNNQLAGARSAFLADMANPSRIDSSLRATLLDDLQLSKPDI